MLVVMPKSAVYTKKIKSVPRVLDLQRVLQTYIGADSGSCAYFSLSDLQCNIFTQTSPDICNIYNAKGVSRKLPKITFPISILRDLFGITYHAAITKLLGESPDNIFISIVQIDTDFFLKFITIENYSGGLRPLDTTLEMVCAKTSLYMDKSFAKAIPFPKASLTNQQAFILGHVFDCLYVDDILTRVVMKPSDDGQVILEKWATASWLDELIKLAEAVDLPIRGTVTRIQSEKIARKLSIRQIKPADKCIGKTNESAYIKKIYPVESFSLHFDKVYH